MLAKGMNVHILSGYGKARYHSLNIHISLLKENNNGCYQGQTNEHKTGWDQSSKLFIKALICTCNKWDSNL